MEKVELLTNYGIDINKALVYWEDMDGYNKNLSIFRDEIDKRLASFKEYIQNEDYENYKKLVVSMKNECKYLGFIKEYEYFETLEFSINSDDKSFFKKSIKEIEQRIENMKKLLNKYFEKKTILIADDSNIIRDYLGKMLDNDYEIIKACNGREAIQKIDKDLYAIFLDLNMPIANGFLVLSYLEEQELFDKIPVIVITGDDTKETINKAFNYPIIDVLNKPFGEYNIKRVLISISNFYEKIATNS